MTLAKWDEAVRVAKIRLKLDPNDFSVIKGKLLKEAQIIYKILLHDS
tara:strand:+ start:514 stop:654 length:141 start_codon:yes stop_codon:yes gene_type:complete